MNTNYNESIRSKWESIRPSPEPEPEQKQEQEQEQEQEFFELHFIGTREQCMEYLRKKKLIE